MAARMSEERCLLLDCDERTLESYEECAIYTSNQRNHLFNRKTKTFIADFDTDRPSTADDAESDAERINIKTTADVVSVFVVAFDTRAGNIVEWCIPENSMLDGIEFKAMVSGSHRITYDFVYFKKGPLFGLSCFENMPIDSSLERGARMKSVGVLASSYRQLHYYKPFLETQVTLLLQSPGNYEELRAFFEARKGILPSSRQLETSTSCAIPRPLSLKTDFKISHPAGCLAQFVCLFGERVFVLWKFALLRKRILFFSPPPIGIVCYRVYCADCLSNYYVQHLTPKKSNVMFYVNVADIDMLEREDNYIACVTEKIFEEKPQLYDIYVDGQNMRVPSIGLRDMATVTAADKTQFAKLSDIHRQMNTYGNEASSEDESEFVSFFTNLNNDLLTMLLEASWTQEKQLSPKDVRRVGLDPNASGDRKFLAQLVELHGIDVDPPADNPCCPV